MPRSNRVWKGSPLVLILIVLSVSSSSACSDFGKPVPDFNFPERAFYQELVRISGTSLPLPENGCPPYKHYRATTDVAAISDLRQALISNGTELGNAEKLLEAYEGYRGSLAGFDGLRAIWKKWKIRYEHWPRRFWPKELDPWYVRVWSLEQKEALGGLFSLFNETPEGDPVIPLAPIYRLSITKSFTLPDGLPEEFKRYERGALAYLLGKADDAEEAFESVLQLPEEQRHYRTTWANYMLGRLKLDIDPQAAGPYFEATIKAAASGFADSLHLTDSCKGRHLMANYKAGDYATACRGYIENLRKGDATAFLDLDNLCSLLTFEPEPVISRALMDPVTADVVVSFLLSKRQVTGKYWGYWLRCALHDAEICPEWSGKMAATAYWSYDLNAAVHFLKFSSPTSFFGQWTQAKLAMREGNIDQADSLFKRLLAPEDGVPSEPDWREREAYKNWLEGDYGTFLEIGGKYKDACWHFALGGWKEKAHNLAAGKVSLDDLRDLAKREPYTEIMRVGISRRLLRERQWAEAKDYLTPDENASFEQISSGVKCLSEPGLSDAEKADKLWNAWIVCRSHPEFVTETGLISWANKEFSTLKRWDTQRFDSIPRLLTEPDSQGLSFAWLATSYLPDGSEELAAKLCLAGSSIKVRNPELADPFYKALVRRCKSLPLGKLADLKHWFPDGCKFQEWEWKDLTARKELARSLSELLDEGRKAVKDDNYPAAIAIFRKGLVLDPDNPTVQGELGYALFLAGELDEAESILQRARWGDSSRNQKASVWYNLGRIAEKRGHMEEAMKNYRQSLAFHENSAVQKRLDSLRKTPEPSP